MHGFVIVHAAQTEAECFICLETPQRLMIGSASFDTDQISRHPASRIQLHVATASGNKYTTVTFLKILYYSFFDRQPVPSGPP